MREIAHSRVSSIAGTPVRRGNTIKLQMKDSPAIVGIFIHKHPEGLIVITDDLAVFDTNKRIKEDGILSAEVLSEKNPGNNTEQKVIGFSHNGKIVRGLHIATIEDQFLIHSEESGGTLLTISKSAAFPIEAYFEFDDTDGSPGGILKDMKRIICESFPDEVDEIAGFPKFLTMLYVIAENILVHTNRQGNLSIGIDRQHNRLLFDIRDYGIPAKQKMQKANAYGEIIIEQIAYKEIKVSMDVEKNPGYRYSGYWHYQHN